MTTKKSIFSALDSLQSSLSSASICPLDRKHTGFEPNGLSLLDTKNELMLSYLQNIVFLMIVKLRNLGQSSDNPEAEESFNDITKKLVELRVYLEKGVRPLEAKLKYQLDKLLAATSGADSKAVANQLRIQADKENGRKVGDDLDAEDDSPNAEQENNEISELSYRPNIAAFKARPDANRDIPHQGDGIYRPPRIAPTAPPSFDQRSRTKRPRKSALVEDFIREDMADAPIAEPSIGTGSGLRGKDLERAEERKAFEEQRLIRLPGEKKNSRRRGEGDGQLDLGFGSLADVDLGDLRGRGGKKKIQGEGLGREVGEKWEKRVKKGLKRKRH